MFFIEGTYASADFGTHGGAATNALKTPWDDCIYQANKLLHMIYSGMSSSQLKFDDSTPYTVFTFFHLHFNFKRL